MDTSSDDGKNQSKSDKVPREWMPTDGSYRYECMRKWDFLMKKYELVMAAEDLGAIAQVLRACL